LRGLADETKKYLIDLEKQKQRVRWHFEEQRNQILDEMRSQAEKNKAEEFRLFTEYNAKLSQRNLELEDLSRGNRAMFGALKDQCRGILDFWNEKVEVAGELRNAKKRLFTERGPRPAEQEVIDSLQGTARILIARQTEVAGSFTEMKRALVKQERALNRRFGKRPKVGVVRAYQCA
jgi:hypothetical protein